MSSLFHLVKPSPWPLVTSLCWGGFIFSQISCLEIKVDFWFNLSQFLFCLIFSPFYWWRDIDRESLGGDYSSLTVSGLKVGMLLFIVSEICFFGSFFWGFFHSSFSPSVELGEVWPPTFLFPFNPYSVPFLNTVVLLSSGSLVTWSHYSLVNGEKVEGCLIQVVFLGIYFSFLQNLEYYLSPFSIVDSVYGSLFFVATGFHGLHVLIGTIMLLICFLRILKGSMGVFRHLGFEVSIWYWHFVDVVWLFLYVWIYWWGC